MEHMTMAPLKVGFEYVSDEVTIRSQQRQLLVSPHPHRVHWNGRAFDRGSTTEGDSRPLYFEVTPA
jgi:hypothetical protein